MTIQIKQGDITKEDVDAIVNAANSSLLGGGGVDGAIHRAGGPQILAECLKIVAMQGRCAPGDAVITSGGKLKARHVIHTVGPIWRNGQTNEDVILASAYTNSLELASDYELSTIAFPSISTGAYGYPVELAAKVALESISRFLQKQSTVQSVTMVLFDQQTLKAYQTALQLLQ
ncbi:MAG: O-acetyl-ADP-ribose deacetylase [Candidatus Obscuribacter sp.]|jgi:O-acetyl-ADP-ribose deacetylase (regulator of RNase III)|nr:O-acetyl-ADP-ribose deacetylase [Candidatus Obscuribacter sp.]MBP6593444.1 O-acetyl-ADP-ribose deacetylase [Candidatus Obscuribacter sp.]